MMRRRTAHLMKNARFLGRRAKQMIMVLSDVIAMPAALWTAFLLHTGTISSEIRANGWLYAATILITIPVFMRLGLYRAVVRFLGIHAALAIALGVSVSTLSLLLINQFFLQSQVPIAVFAIYFALAVLYVGASRFGARELLRMGNVGARPVAIYGAGAAGAQLCTSLSTSTHFRPLAFVDDNQKFQGARVCGLQVFAPEKLLELRRTPRRATGVPRIAQRFAPPAQRNHRKADGAGLPGSDRSGHQRNRFRPVTPRRNPRHRCPRPSRPRSGSAESRAAVRLHPRQVDPGHRRGRIHRFRAVPPDHGAGAASAGIAGGFRARALRNRTRAALASMHGLA